MKIWIVEIGEPLPLEKNVRLHRYGQFTAALAQMGHDVTWWTSSFSHAPKKHLVEADTEIFLDGRRLRIIHGPGYSRNVSLERIRHNKHFAGRLAELVRSETAPDIIIAPIPVIEIAEVLARYSLEKRVPLVVDIRDEWPDDLKNLAPRPLRTFARLALFRAYRKMRYVCQGATGILGVGRRHLEYGLGFAERSENENDLIFPLGYSSQRLPEEKLEEGRVWCRQIGLRSEAFVCCFFGTIGKFFQLETVIEAARILGKEFDVQFVLGGDGSALAKYKKLAKDVPNVIFPGWLDAPKIQATMEMSRVGLAPYFSDSSMSLPNKPFEYMFGALPVVSSIQGELATMLGENGCGITYRSDDVDAFCDAIRYLHADTARAAEMGRRGHALFERDFQSEKVFARVARHLEGIVAREQAAAAAP